MIVAFYAPMHGQCAVSSNTLSIASVMALLYDVKILILQSHFDMNNMEALVVRKPKTIDDMDILDDYGMDSLIRNMNLEQINKKMIENSCYSFVNDRIHLLPGTKEVNREMFEYSMDKTIVDVMEEANKHYDYVFIDVNSGRNQITEKILTYSDMVAVNLSQNPQVIDHFFERNTIDLKKVIYLLGNYDRRSRFTVTNITLLYSQINKKDVAAIEYCVAFRDAIWNASVLKFFRKNLNCRKKDKNYGYIQSVKDAARLIMRKAGDKRVK